MILVFLLAQVMVAVPAAPRPQLDPPADLSRLSIIVADTVSETDPRPLCDQPNCRSLFLAKYANAVVIAGPEVSPEFTARAEMGSPWNMHYRLALIVEHRDGQEPFVRAMAGFGDRTHEACFEPRDTDNLNWTPAGPKIIMRRKVICIAE